MEEVVSNTSFKKQVWNLAAGFQPDALAFFRVILIDFHPEEGQGIWSKMSIGKAPTPFLKLVSENLFLVTKPAEKPSLQ